MKNRKFIVTASIIAIAFIMIGRCLAMPAEAKGEGQIIVVSLGDSYSSGEGIPPFGTKETIGEKVSDYDWLAHRSEDSWQSMLFFPGLNKPLKDYRVRFNETGGGYAQSNDECAWYFVAASGATTENINGVQNKTYIKHDPESDTPDLPIKDTVTLPAQMQVFDYLERGSVDYVTITIGGNDLGFADIVAKAAKTPTALYEKPAVIGAFSTINKANLVDSNKLYYMIEEQKYRYFNGDEKNQTPVRERIKQVYMDIHNKCGNETVIIVVGYPTLLSDKGAGALFSKSEAKWINDAAVWLDKELEALVVECQTEGLNIVYVSVLDEFKGHEAYTKNDYIFPVYPLAKEEDINYKKVSSYSMHPNKNRDKEGKYDDTGRVRQSWDGTSAYAKCVQGKLDELGGGIVSEKTENTVAAIDVNQVDKEYIQTVLSPFSKPSVGYTYINSLPKNEIIFAVSRLIENSYMVVGTRNYIDFHYVYLGLDGSWNIVRTNDFSEAGKYIYGTDITYEDVVKAWEGIAGFKTSDEVDYTDEFIDLGGVEIDDTDFLFSAPNGRGGYYGITVDSLTADQNILNVDYHIDYYDSERKIYETIIGCHAVLEATNKDTFPFMVVSISRDSDGAYDDSDEHGTESRFVGMWESISSGLSSEILLREDGVRLLLGRQWIIRGAWLEEDNHVKMIINGAVEDYAYDEENDKLWLDDHRKYGFMRVDIEQWKGFNGYESVSYYGVSEYEALVLAEKAYGEIYFTEPLDFSDFFITIDVVGGDDNPHYMIDWWNDYGLSDKYWRCYVDPKTKIVTINAY